MRYFLIFVNYHDNDLIGKDVFETLDTAKEYVLSVTHNGVQTGLLEGVFIYSIGDNGIQAEAFFVVDANGFTYPNEDANLAYPAIVQWNSDKRQWE